MKVYAIRLALIVLLVGTGLSAAPASEAQSDISVLRVEYASRAELEALARLVEPWEVHTQPDGSGYAIVGVDAAGLERVRALGLRFTLDADRTERLHRTSRLPAIPGSIPGYACYRSLDETYAAAQALVQAYPSLASWNDIGDSWDKTAPGGAAGRDLQVLVLTNQAIPGPKPILFLMSGLHAREYAPVELLTRFAERLLSRYATDADAAWMLDYQEIHLLLEANPDGRQHAEAGVLWRKNTNQAYCGSFPSGRGADLNRNFAFHWGGSGSSGYACDETYRGPSANSEPETQAIQSYLLAHFPDQRGPGDSDPAAADTAGMFIDVHSYGRLVLWPWGSTDSPPPNAAGLQTLGYRLAYANGHQPQQAIGLYPTHGTSDEYAYGTLGLAALTFEIGDNFFQSCPAFEADILPRNLDSLLYAARVARAPYQLPAGPEVVQLTIAGPGFPQPATATLSAVLDDSRFSLLGPPYEAVQPLATAEFTLDVPPWAADAGTRRGALLPQDGAWDEAYELAGAVIDVSTLSAGQHTVYVHAQDAAGNWGPVTAAFLQVSAHVQYLPLALD